MDSIQAKAEVVGVSLGRQVFGHVYFEKVVFKNAKANIFDDLYLSKICSYLKIDATILPLSATTCGASGDLTSRLLKKRYTINE